MHPLVEVAARHLRSTAEGALGYADDDVQAILRASASYGNGEALYAATTELISFVAFLRKSNGERAARTLIEKVLSVLAERLTSSSKDERFRERAQQLAKLEAESTDTGAAMKRPTLKGVGLRRR